MKKTNLFVIFLLVIISFSSCNGGSKSSSSNSLSSETKSDFDKLEIVDKGFSSDGWNRYKDFLIKNISNEKVSFYELNCKFYKNDGTSFTQYHLINLAPDRKSVV